jgi:hypothetical protein
MKWIMLKIYGMKIQFGVSLKPMLLDFSWIDLLEPESDIYDKFSFLWEMRCSWLKINSF